MNLIRMTKNGVNHAVRDGKRLTACRLMLGVHPLEEGPKRLCVDCKRRLTPEEREEVWRER